jgi:BTB/POZ domain
MIGMLCNCQCRGMLSAVASTAELPLSDDAATVRLLISSMYDPYSDVSWSNVKPLLELARKYDIEDIQHKCAAFLEEMPLTTSELQQYMELARTFDIHPAVDRCHEYIADGRNYKDLMR